MESKSTKQWTIIGKSELGAWNEAREWLIELWEDNKGVPYKTHVSGNQTDGCIFGHQRPIGNQIDYKIGSESWRSSMHCAKTRPGADCDTDPELLIWKN